MRNDSYVIFNILFRYYYVKEILFIYFCYYYKYYVDNEEIQNIIYYNFKFLNDIILFLFLFKLIFDLKIL